MASENCKIKMIKKFKKVGIKVSMGKKVYRNGEFSGIIGSSGEVIYINPTCK